ncbi:MAG: HlyD family efflux transporter periplasmic adaptor subunit [Calditrichaeota bacterium]|nr:HlyD family efflux transporter periplasmic adaptor subunit [Calditrichota bacterium]
MKMINQTMKGLTLLLLFLGLLSGAWSCSGQKGRAQQETQETHAEEADDHDRVTISPEEMEEFGIRLAEAGPGVLEIHRDLTGEIGIDPEKLAHVVPRFPGIVVEVKKRIGDRVEKGEVLAVIESNESLTPYEVRSLIKGTVIEMHLTRGEMISDATHAFVVADLCTVWANLNVYQSDLPYIKVGQKAIVEDVEGTIRAEGTISYVSPIVDDETRTAVARVILPNPDGKWRPGMFVTARVITDRLRPAIVVPKTALQIYENQTVVFVKDGDGFRPQPVKLGRTNLVSAEIVQGLSPGQIYVAEGGFTLKAELLKESFGGGHSH